MASVYIEKTTHFYRQGQNKPPVVKILSPENNTSVEPDARIRYFISVSDEEDGKSEFQEIASNEVFLEVTYAPDSSKVADYLVIHNKNGAEPPGLTGIKTSDCFNCHAIKNKGQGPSFSEIAKRYPHNPSTIETLAMRVMKGNSGVWGNAAMPPHADITPQQARQIIQWILNNAADPNYDLYAGLEGSFPTRTKSQTGGLYVLTASYLDHGLKDMPQLRQSGQHTILLKGK
ncbi:c-type cytochrome [Rhodocytophaga rosea]|uniref:C-type cytochrome n=1 Tax=Rhodocytophaga rosea TaxID=2704465 RepID=A0A6C0GVC7_9BACT|nr:c-type cytochrome [Rhodocytophaga rosea]QHT71513.1 c-type cytochrome [Rhodocytophaga rosea]